MGKNVGPFTLPLKSMNAFALSWALPWAVSWAFVCAFSCGLAAYAEDAPDYLREAQTCSRVDLRPSLEKAGFELIRNRGGREDNFSFAFSELLGVELGEPISARWLEHFIEEHQASSFRKLETTSRAILAGRLRACSEDAVKSEDIESTRLARLRLLAKSQTDLNSSFAPIFQLFGTHEFAQASFTPWSCDESGRTHAKPRASLTLTESKRLEMIDRSLRAGRLAIVIVRSRDHEPNTFAIAGRRLAAASGRCEYLVRNYQGPTCLGSNCEDGSEWIERETFSKSLETVWSLEP